MRSFWGTFSVFSAICLFGLSTPRIAHAQECDPDSGNGCYSSVLDCDPDSDPTGCYARVQGDKLRVLFHQKIDQVLADYPCASATNSGCQEHNSVSDAVEMTKAHSSFISVCGMSDWDLVQNFSCSTDLSVVNPYAFSSNLRDWNRLTPACRNLLRLVAYEQAREKVATMGASSASFEAHDLALKMTEPPIACGASVAPSISKLAGSSKLIVGRDSKMKELSRLYCPEPKKLTRGPSSQSKQ